MNVDTGAFAALTGRLDDLERQVAELAQGAAFTAAMYEAAIAEGRRREAAERDPWRPVRRPRYLRSLPGGAS